jgi:hypothetical protein
VIVTGNLPAGEAPSRPDGGRLLASVDVEWSKNYRVKGGNVPFCFSVTWLALPGGDGAVTDSTGFWYTSAYVDDDAERGDLIAAADAALGCIADHASLVTGHQLCSDLAVLAAAAEGKPAAIEAARNAWRRRREAEPGRLAWLDTRYDAGHVLGCQSRRLVDVCNDLRLDVSQPELRGASMTALHRRWIERSDIQAREKITVLNLRHSLSTAIVAARAAGLAHWQPGLNVNRLIAAQLGGELGWTASPVFTKLLGDPGAA